MALERDFITPANVVVQTTANVVGNTASLDMFGNTQRSTVYPDISMNFAKAGYLDPRVTFARASTATYTDEFGYIRTANTNIPRFQYANGVCEGLLIEESRTNLFRNESPIGAARRIAGTATGPDGKSAYAIILDRGFQQYNGFGGGSTYSFSLTAGQSVDMHYTCFVGPQFGPQVQTIDLVIAIDLNNTGTNITYGEWLYNYNANTTVARYVPTDCTQLGFSVEPHPCGMNKLTWSVRYTQAGTTRNNIGLVIQIRDSAASGEYNADGISGVQYACCQFEIGNQPSSYIPTGATSVTRAADYAYVVADKYNFNPRQGTFFIRAKSSKTNTPSQQAGNDAATYFNILDSWSQTQNDELGVQRYNADYSIIAFNALNGAYRSTSIANSSLAIQANSYVSAAVSYYTSNTFVLVANGVVSGAASYHRPLGNQLTPTQTILNIGNHYNFTQRSINGPVALLSYYSTPLSNTQLQAMTI